MLGLVDQWANQTGWRVRKGNVIVEGVSDVKLLDHAAALYEAKHGVRIVGDDFSLIAAGIGDDGGVDGVNRRLNTARELSELDRTWDGAVKYRFVGLFDNDEAGRRAIVRAAAFNRRLIRYRDLFLVLPVMPFASGADGPTVEKRAAELNKAYRSLDWEIEDLVSQDFLEIFEIDFPNAVRGRNVASDKVHREFTPKGKTQLIQYFIQHATIDDAHDLIKLICALRNYVQLPHEHIDVA